MVGELSRSFTSITSQRLSINKSHSDDFLSRGTTHLELYRMRPDFDSMRPPPLATSSFAPTTRGGAADSHRLSERHRSTYRLLLLLRTWLELFPSLFKFKLGTETTPREDTKYTFARKNFSHETGWPSARMHHIYNKLKRIGAEVRRLSCGFVSVARCGGVGVIGGDNKQLTSRRLESDDGK